MSGLDPTEIHVLNKRGHSHLRLYDIEATNDEELRSNTTERISEKFLCKVCIYS